MWRNRQRFFLLVVSSLLVMDATLHIGLIWIHGRQSIVTYSENPHRQKSNSKSNLYQTQNEQYNLDNSEYDAPVSWPPGFLQDPFRWNLRDWLQVCSINWDTVNKDGLTYLVNSENVNYSFLRNEDVICANNGRDMDLLVVVDSNPDNAGARAAIRDTWGGEIASTQGYKLLFAVGKSEESYIDETVDQEKADFADIIQADFKESDFNCSMKTAMILNWTANYCPESRFLLRTMEDVFFNVTGLKQLVAAVEGRNDVLLGYLHRDGSQVTRLNSSRWFVPFKVYPWNEYPPHLSKESYLLPTKTASKLAASSSQLPFFYMEEVWLTGMLANVSGVSLQHVEAMPYLTQPLDRCGVISSSGHSPQLMRKKWTVVKSKFFRCSSVLLEDGDIDYLIQMKR